MHNFVMSIGQAIASYFANFSGKGLLDALKVMGIGYLGIFIVTAIIILAVYLLNRFTQKK